MAEVAAWRIVRRALPLLLAAVLSAAPPAAASAPPGWAGWELTPGVEHLLTERPGLVARAARVAAGAPVALRPVVAFDRVGGGHAPNDGRQPVSELCGRVGGIVCVNGDFLNCPTCGQPFGGLVHGARLLRSFRPHHGQVSIVGGRPTFDPLRWEGTLRATAGSLGLDLPLASLNRGPVTGQAVVYSPDWGPVTPQVPGQIELVLATGGPHVAGVVHAVPVARRVTSGPIPRDGVVIAANGAAAVELDRLWDAWHGTAGPRRLVLDTALSAPADLGLGGHPVLLRDGVRAPLDPRDPMTMERHPRTLLGWTGASELLLVTIDGRQPGHSDGATLSEATDLLVELGATDAINLDGGGSTTFALRCGTGACVANRPSGGRERPVSLALALVPVPGSSGVLRPPEVARAPAPTTTTTVMTSTTTTTTTSTTTTTIVERAPSPSAPRRTVQDDVAMAPAASGRSDGDLGGGALVLGLVVVAAGLAWLLRRPPRRRRRRG